MIWVQKWGLSHLDINLEEISKIKEIYQKVLDCKKFDSELYFLKFLKQDRIIEFIHVIIEIKFPVRELILHNYSKTIPKNLTTIENLRNIQKIQLRTRINLKLSKNYIRKNWKIYPAKVRFPKNNPNIMIQKETWEIESRMEKANNIENIPLNVKVEKKHTPMESFNNLTK